MRRTWPPQHSLLASPDSTLQVAHPALGVWGTLQNLSLPNGPPKDEWALLSFLFQSVSKPKHNKTGIGRFGSCSKTTHILKNLPHGSRNVPSSEASRLPQWSGRSLRGKRGLQSFWPGALGCSKKNWGGLYRFLWVRGRGPNGNHTEILHLGGPPDFHTCPYFQPTLPRQGTHFQLVGNSQK